ncbi:hypothetical protein [uncultured Microscilla sp.]|uniref:hypothetical protein n=1 Tax=uncultured Microscilla sp. TaxID=432653 RepID=UPI002630F959|nr:hypothetical protein [uncultured Microscilla sp.]
MAQKKSFGWVDVDIMLFNQISIEISKIEYKTSQEKKNGYGRGSKPTRRTRGKKESTLSMSIAMVEVVQIEKAARVKYGEGANLLDIEPFDIPVVYDNGEELVADVIKDVEFTSTGRSISEGDMDAVQDFDCICSDVLYAQPV